MSNYVVRDEFDMDVYRERSKQDEKWGEQNHSAPIWMLVLAEEVGELNKAILENYEFPAQNDDPSHPENVKEELIQIAAVCKAIYECGIRNNWKGFN